MTPFPPDVLAHAGSGLAVGLLVGIERGWKLRGEADGMRVAGIRTFTLLGLVAGVAGLMAAADYAFVSGITVAAAALLAIIGYGKAVLGNGSPDATSAVSALAVLALGFLGGAGEPALAVAGGAVMTLILALRTEVHGLIDRLDEADIKALARYAVIALAVYPFLPEGRYGPYDAWEPRTLWLVVVLVTGFSFAGYVANRIFGAKRGTIATAIIGGAYSSTAVTQSLAHRLGTGEASGAENAGIALATTVMYLRVMLLVGVLATPLLASFSFLILPALLTASGASLWLYRRAAHGSGPAPPGNPIALVPAFGFAAFVAVAAVAARWAQDEFGEQGIAVLILLMGSMDVDAAIVTAGGLEPGTIADELAALAIGGTIFLNMALKLGVTIAYGRSAANQAAWALGASMLVLAGTLVVGYVQM